MPRDDRGRRCGSSSAVLRAVRAPQRAPLPRQPAGQVCASGYEVIARQRPESSWLEIAGVAGLLLGSALVVVGLIAALVLLIGD